MGIFKRKEPAPKVNESDQQVLQQLAEIGADARSPRLQEHFVYCDTDADAALLESRAAAAGRSVSRVVPDYHGIVAKRSDLPVNAETIANARDFFEGLAAAVPGGDYDGWGAEGG